MEGVPTRRCVCMEIRVSSWGPRSGLWAEEVDGTGVVSGGLAGPYCVDGLLLGRRCPV